MKRHNIITFSGGKDSTALLVWAIEKFGVGNFTTIFCDTNWEAPETYEYIQYVQSKTGVLIETITSNTYPDGLVQLAVQKGRFPSVKARFCTTELKVIPMIDFILSLNGEVNIYQGIRKDESISRSRLNPADDYFLHYHTPIGKDKKGKNRYHSYRKKDVLEWLTINQAIVYRPLFNQSVTDVFELINKGGLEPNQLYKQGFSRVGCMPCIMCTKSEMKLISDNKPEIVAKIVEAENLAKSTFFGPNYLPTKHCSRTVLSKNGKRVKVPKIEDVVTYTKSNINQVELFPQPNHSCQSIYHLCE